MEETMKLKNVEKQQATKPDQRGIQRIEKAVELDYFGLNPTFCISCMISDKLCTLWIDFLLNKRR